MQTETITPTDAHNMGGDARMNGATYNDNPFDRSTHNHAAWMEGYREADVCFAGYGNFFGH